MMMYDTTVSFIGSELVSHSSPYRDQVLNKDLFIECLRVDNSSHLKKTSCKTETSMLSPLMPVTASEWAVLILGQEISSTNSVYSLSS